LNLIINAIFTFQGNSFGLNGAEIKALGKLALQPGYKLVIAGYVVPKLLTKSNSLELSLNRALTLKMALEKLHPKWMISTIGMGHLTNPKCASYHNNCVVFREIKSK